MIDRIATPKKTLEIINRYEFDFQKRFGQNFLIDSNIIDKIISNAAVTSEDVVIEIGPGIGSLTQVLAENAKTVIAVEIDKKLIPILNEVLSDYHNIHLINNDILKVDLYQLMNEVHPGKMVKIIANLPYYITTPIIMGIFENHLPVASITVMVQKEVAERMQAKPGSKDYGALSLAVQYYSDAHIVTHVGPNCFIPAPKVGSSVIQLRKHDRYSISHECEKMLFQLIKTAFGQRRKTLVNTLSGNKDLNISKEIIISAIHSIGLDDKVRGEVLSLEQFIQLANVLASK